MQKDKNYFFKGKSRKWKLVIVIYQNTKKISNSDIEISNMKQCYKMCRRASNDLSEYNSIFVYILWMLYVLYGLKLYKNMELIWYYRMELGFWWKIWLEYSIFIYIFSKMLLWKLIYRECLKSLIYIWFLLAHK